MFCITIAVVSNKKTILLYFKSLINVLKKKYKQNILLCFIIFDQFQFDC